MEWARAAAKAARSQVSTRNKAVRDGRRNLFRSGEARGNSTTWRPTGPKIPTADCRTPRRGRPAPARWQAVEQRTFTDAWDDPTTTAGAEHHETLMDDDGVQW